MMKKPEVDSIEGLSPAISIEQKSISHNPRSTVGTVTEIYDYLRLLFAKIGIQHCVDCKIPVEQKSLDQIVDEILVKYYGLKVQILAPLVRGRKGHYKELFDQLLRQGFTKVRVDGNIKEIEDGMQLSRYQVHNIELVIDRLVIHNEQIHRISESVELALNRAEGTLIILYETSADKWDEKLFSTSYSCPSCGKSYQDPAPNMFSFNSPYGACQHCQGLGEINEFDIHLVIPDPTKSIDEGGIVPLGKKREMWLWAQVESFANQFGVDMSGPISEIPKEELDKLLWGLSGESLPVNYSFSGGKEITYKQKYTGILPSLRHQYENTSSNAIRTNIEIFMSNMKCPACHGGRLKPENLAVLIHGNSIFDIVKFDFTDAFEYFTNLAGVLTDREMLIANLILKEII